MKILVLTSRFPYPIEKGDKLRIFNQIRELSVRHEIVLCAISEQEVKASDFKVVKQFCDKIYIFNFSKLTVLRNLVGSFFNNLPLQVAYFYNKKTAQQIGKIVNREKPDHIYCQLTRTTEYVRQLDFPKTVDYMDAYSTNTKRWAEDSSVIKKWILRREARKQAIYEREIFKDFDNHTIISSQDRDLLSFTEKLQIHIVPNGINLDYFKPLEKKKVKFGISFVGNMGYKPNIAAAQFLIKKIMPKVWAKHPDTNVLIAGARPSPEVLKLESNQVKVSGWVDDIREAYTAANIFVAPLFLGSGQQNKILEAMALGVPCITSELVNNAIGAKPGKSILLANTPSEFAERIIELSKNVKLQKELSENALKFIQNNYNWNFFVSKLEAIISGDEKQIEFYRRGY